MRHALATNLEVQVIGRGMSGTPDGADERSSFHAVSRFDEIGAVMRIDRDQSVRVGDLDDASIRGLTSAEDHDPRGGGVDGCTARSFDIHPSMPAPETAPAKGRGYGTVHGPGEVNPVDVGRELRARAIREAVRDSMAYRSIPVGFTD